MLRCLNCHEVLVRAQANPGVFWFCPACGSRSATIGLLRKKATCEVVNALWLTASEESTPKVRRCLECSALMAEVPLQLGQSRQKIDVCTRCQTVWFDPQEYVQIPARPAPKRFLEKLPPEARERYAMLELEAIRERADKSDAWSSGGIEEPWQYLPAFFGLPVESDVETCDQTPWVTWVLSALIVVVSLFAFTDPHVFLERLALIPADFLRYGGVTLLTSFFVHGGLFHLLSNVYFLMVFGDNVEFLIGRVRFVLLILLATLMGDLAHISGNAGSMVPCIGASGGISGVITYYALAFPHAKLGFLFRFGFIFKWAKVSAGLLFVIWLAIQFLGIRAQRAGISDVSAMAHLGGAAVGFAFWLAGRWKEAPDV